MLLVLLNSTERTIIIIKHEYIIAHSTSLHFICINVCWTKLSYYYVPKYMCTWKKKKHIFPYLAHYDNYYQYTVHGTKQTIWLFWFRNVSSHCMLHIYYTTNVMLLPLLFCFSHQLKIQVIRSRSSPQPKNIHKRLIKN